MATLSFKYSTKSIWPIRLFLDVFDPCNFFTLIQILVKMGLNSRFVVEANIARSSPKPRQSRVINLTNRTRVTRPRVKYRVEYQVISLVFSTKVEFLLESGNKSLYLWHKSWVIIQLWPTNGQKYKYFGSTGLVIVIIVQNIGIGLNPESNIRPLFDLLFDPK